MNNKNEYICPICGEGTLWTDFTDGTKWGRAYCNRCDCGGPEVCTGYGENFDSPWRANARKLFVDIVNEHVSKRCEVEGMNREEAIKFFELQTQDEQALIDGINLNPDDFVFGAEGPEQYINDCQNNIDAYNTAITALRGPQPDPITGLVPCGCGGKAEIVRAIEYWDWIAQNIVEVKKVQCDKCYMSTPGSVTNEYAMQKWNTAMSGGACSHEN